MASLARPGRCLSMCPKDNDQNVEGPKQPKRRKKWTRREMEEASPLPMPEIDDDGKSREPDDDTHDDGNSHNDG
ncbi:MAG: hypothetical protein B7733_25700 [Myxococcales bacterium FL481]|nr:MAG: hypothetical protein B7733_25700 [Myxococcales bacterium FL481]